MTGTQTLLVDMMPNQGSSIMACVRPPFITLLDSIEILYSFLIDQYCTLPFGRWYGVRCKTHPRRTR